jgi:hypothetical protein
MTIRELSSAEFNALGRAHAARTGWKPNGTKLRYALTLTGSQPGGWERGDEANLTPSGWKPGAIQTKPTCVG